MGEQHRKGHKVFVSNISSNVSKLWRICGCVLAVVYSVWILSSFVTADKHTYGGIALKGESMLNRRIIEQNTVEPTNYTIIYKYVLNKLGGLLSYVEFDVANCSSTGEIQVQMNNGKREDTVLTVNVNVMNCLNLNVTAKIFGHGASMATQLTKDPFTVRLFGDQLFEPKSFAFVYAHNATRSKNRYFKIGQRQTNDTLLKTEKIIVSNTFNNYPQHEIEYIDPNTYITQMDFQFNSPTATAFLNSSFIQAHSFNAIVYDLNRPQFTVNFNVYGYTANNRPSQYKSILTF